MQIIPIEQETLDAFHSFGSIFTDSTEIATNEPVILKSPNGSSGLAIRHGDRLVKIEKKACAGLVPRNAEQIASLHVLCDDAIPLVTLIGKAGSGKTLLALAAALQKITDKTYKRVLIARPMVGLGDIDSMGFLPGDANEKLNVWLGPVWDNLSVLKTDRNAIKKMLDDHVIEMIPLQYIRGRSLNGVFVLIDESQNLTAEDIKTIGTRVGQDCKIVFTGDTDQIDKHRLRAVDGVSHDGLSYLINRTANQPLCAHVKLKKSERSPLCELLTELL